MEEKISKIKEEALKEIENANDLKNWKFGKHRKKRIRRKN